MHLITVIGTACLHKAKGMTLHILLQIQPLLKLSLLSFIGYTIIINSLFFLLHNYFKFSAIEMCGTKGKISKPYYIICFG